MIDTSALREKVLDLAIRGKLVPQDPTDEPASVLLERIRAEKEQMVKDGKLKAKDIKNDTVIFKGEDNLHYEKFSDGTVKCIEDEIPFDVPDGWAWCRFQDVFNICSSKRVLQADWKNEGIPFYRAREIVKLSNHGYVDNDLFISNEHYLDLKEKYGVPQAGDLMVTGVGTIGKVYIVSENEQFYYKDASVLCFENRSGFVNSEYAKTLIESSLVQEQIHSKTYGNTVDTITISTANNYLCLLPPMAEQIRIVEAVKNVIQIISIVENNKTNLSVDILNIKSKILDLAIRGKLVPQNQDDEPASVLLEHIKAEKEELIKQGKIKRDKKESVIFKGEDNSYYEKIGNTITCIDDEIPFEIPENWCWCRLGTIFNHNTGKALKSSNTQGTELTYITTSNVYWNTFVLDNLKTMFFNDNEIEKYTAVKGDLLVCEGGDIGRAAIWHYDTPIRIQNHIHKLRPFTKVNVKFYYYIFNLYKQKSLINGNGIGLQGLSSNALHSLIVPITPLEEQDKIVNAVDKMFSILSEIEKSLS